MKKVLLLISFIFCLSVSAFAMSPRPGGRFEGGHREGGHRGGGTTPEPVTTLLILGGLGAAYGIKKVMDK